MTTLNLLIKQKSPVTEPIAFNWVLPAKHAGAIKHEEGALLPINIR